MILQSKNQDCLRWCAAY